MYERDTIQNRLQRMQISTTEKLLHVIYKLVNLFIEEAGFYIFYLKGQEKIEQNNLKTAVDSNMTKQATTSRVVRHSKIPFCES